MMFQSRKTDIGQSCHVVVLAGGASAEREVSLSSGAECAQALKASGHRVTQIDPGPDLVRQLQDLQPDVVFNALHGRWGEDGCVQGVLEWLGLCYTHSGVLASALAMDKQRCKAAYQAAGVPVAESFLIRRDELGSAHPMPPPYVIKPYNEGSSVGVHIVQSDNDPVPVISDEMPELLMVEQFVPGHELTVTVLDGKALTVTEIVTGDWYDFQAKYVPGASSHVCPAQLPQEIFNACLSLAEAAHQGLGCRGVSRTDFRWDPARGTAGLFALETNTQPGMTPTSLAPEQAQHCGYDFAALCDWLIRDASFDR